MERALGLELGRPALERDAMLEVATNYDVDGIHFDYIRYPASDHCYCDGCRTRFEPTPKMQCCGPPSMLTTPA